MERSAYEAAVEYLERIPSYAREKSSLLTVRRFLDRLGGPDRGFMIFHVAGTNGKGSVCAFLTSALKEAGWRTGTFTSPHLTTVRERFSVDGELVSEEAFADAFSRVKRETDRWVRGGEIHPTYFEFLFYMGLLIFERAKVQVLILETGMGGLLDVTNVIERPLVSMITAISVDHTKYLGNTLAEIAAHKAGIIKAGSPVVFDSSCPEAERAIRKRAKELGCDIYAVGNLCYTVESYREDGMMVALTSAGKRLTLAVPFAAPYQAANAAVAATALTVSGLKIPDEAIRSGIAKAVWPARMERVRPWLYLDGAHNEGGVLAFLEAARMLREVRKPESVSMLFAVSADKDYRTMISLIERKLHPDRWYLAGMDSARALSPDELSETAKAVIESCGDDGAQGLTGDRIQCYENTFEAFRALSAQRPERGLAFIAGSLYLAGEIKKEITDD